MLFELIELYDYNRWANERTLSVAAELGAEEYERPLAGSFPSLRATLEHLLQAEAVWLSRWQGDPLGRAPDLTDCLDPGMLAARWEALWKDQGDFLGSLGEGDLARQVAIRTRSGIDTSQPLGDTLRHVVNHATYHRGQATTLTRQLGGTPLTTDFFIYCVLRDGGELPRRSPEVAVRVQAAEPEYHIIEFQGTAEAAAFVASLSRFLSSPQGAAHVLEPDVVEVWTHSTESSDVVAAYLSEGALKAAAAAFSRVRVAGSIHGKAMPPDSNLIIERGKTRAWDVDDAHRRLTTR